MPAAVPSVPTQLDRVNAYLQVLHALMLRDMRTRFAGSHWGWAVTVLWPVAHMLVLASILTFRKLPAPMGDSTMIFVATGAVPALAFQYVSRECMKGYLTNKPLTYYPQVKVLDTMFARILVEIVGCFAGLAVIFAVLIAIGYDPRPVDITTSLCGYLAAICLGIGIGTINVGIVSFFPGWAIGYALFGILMYMASGVAFMPNFLPEAVYSALRWNPVLQIVEWVRLGYDPSLPLHVDYLYVLLWCGCAITIGLLIERFVVRKAN